MSPASNSSGAPLPSVAILGTDALLAARPATPVQLAHACQAAGYAAVYPVTWGDELLAAACTRRVSSRGDDPAIFCACPHVSDALLEVGSDLARFLVPLVPPPVACARYLRALYGYGRVRITYIGACPGAHDPAIDAHLTPMQFLGVLTQLGIVLHQQPEVFDSVIPPDRRRYRSMPGGAPTSEALRRDGGGHEVHEVIDADWKTELAQRLLLRQPAVFDIAPALGCHCAGARPGVAPAEARGSVVAIEPPRSPSEVIDLNVAVDVDRTLPLVPQRPQSGGGSVVMPASPPDEHATSSGPALADVPLPEEAASGIAAPAVAAEPPVAPAAEHETPPPSPPIAASAEEPQPAHLDAVRRRVAAPVVAHAAQAVPVTRTGSGQILPRAYAARRRTPSNGMDVVSAQASVTPVPRSTEPERIDAEPERIVAEPEAAIALAEPIVADTATPSDAAPEISEPPVAETTAPEGAVAETTTGEATAPRATPRSVVVPIPTEELRPVPPPPVPDHARTAVITGVATVAIAVAAFAASRDDGRVTEESSGVAAPMSAEIDSLPLVFPLQPDTSASATIADTSGVEAAADSGIQRDVRDVAPESPPTRTSVPSKRPRRRAITPRRRADSSSTASALAESLAHEREAIRRELEERRARLDTIARSLHPDPAPHRR
jgi:hypothetical protein